MNDPAVSPVSSDRDARLRLAISRAAGIATLLLLVGTMFLSSPRPDQTYPGQLPWSEYSVLRGLIWVTTLGWSVETARGVEIKDLVFHGAAVLGLLLLAARTLLSRQPVRIRDCVKQPWLAAQFLLLAWVALSLASALWSGDAALSIGQGVLYALALAWAISLAWTLERRDLPWILGGVVAISSLCALTTIWYYIERNPHHRPGFPIGNPNSLAACLLPAIVIALSVAGSTLRRRWREGGWHDVRQAAWCCVALLPLLIGFWLAGSLAAKIGVVAGIGTLVFLQVGPRRRWWVMLAALLIVASAVTYRFSGVGGLSMGRGASARFRLYAWRYASTLWQTHPWFGAGAGAYPRLANGLSIEDEMLDPAAFMAPMRGHAHNELFEILAEVGLIGGTVYVAGYLATLAGGWVLLRRRQTGTSRLLLLGVLASVVALMADGGGSVGMRLPGVPVLFYTMIGVIWALGRCDARGDGVAEAIAAIVDPRAAQRPRAYLPRVAGAAVCLAAACGAGYFTTSNWIGVIRERQGPALSAAGDLAGALRATLDAESRLLDPVRRLGADERVVRYRFAIAVRAFYALGGEDTDEAARQAHRAQAARLLVEAYEAAVYFDQRIPNLGDTPTIGARCAEMLARLADNDRPDEARQWRRLAAQAWAWQRRHNRYHVDALLALSQPLYGATLPVRVTFLRDALRLGRASDERWMRSLRWLAREPGFEAALTRVVQAAGPIDPRTSVDAIVASMAPEAYRLSAAWRSLRGEHAVAAEQAARAAALYEPLHARFPTLRSVALSEQAECLFRASPRETTPAAALVRQAYDALPNIQPQQFDALARPYYLQIVGYELLAPGREDEARQAFIDQGLEPVAALADAYVDLARAFIHAPLTSRPATVGVWLTRAIQLEPTHVEAWQYGAWLAAETGRGEAVAGVLADARKAGLTDTDIARIRALLAAEFIAPGGGARP